MGLSLKYQNTMMQAYWRIFWTNNIFVLYWKSTPTELVGDEGNEYYFGNAANPTKLQFILDSIIFY
ncbi:hypothetical protein ALP99_102495 [Pseudomonas syringae pv. tomato]|nr:hypothetical protein PSPTOT1_1333 [Pseudomonas syringae pv. tomato T1]RMQ72931.1 hypothetical protein ALQ00_102389 [Pseudomonas syringae pv. tomato]RMQ76009.1 hypothetical protein ALP99_102495 [Pseudomonas syringae pv. tomato]RMV00135.1 hypothetical protein ALP19_102306 [Pseudomonas syringae pv. tomato]